MYERFKHPNVKNNGLYVFVVIPSTILTDLILIPELNGVSTASLSGEGEAIPVSYKTLKECLSYYKLNKVGDKVLILLNVKWDCRMYPVDEIEINHWIGFLSSYGISEADFKTLSERDELLNTTEWN